MPRLALVVALMVTLPSAMHAQDTATTFRRGQWGAEVGLGLGFSSLGAIRFSTPQRAWVADVGGDVGWRSSSSTGSQQGDYQSTQLRLGRRSYRPLADAVQRLVTIGVLGGYSRSHSTFAVGGNSGETTNLALVAGAYADIGAQWLVTSHLSLGATWGVTVRYRYETSRSSMTPVQPRSHEVSVSFAGAGLRGAFYF